MPSKTEKELEDAKQHLHDIVWPLLNDNDPKTWKLKGGKDKTSTGLVYRGQHKKLGIVWRLECELDISVQQFRDIFIDKLVPTDWAPHVGEYKILEEAADGSWEITYTLSAGVPAVDDRDFVNLRFRQFLENGTIYELTEATTHPSAPKRPKCIRGEYLPSGCLVRSHPNDPKRSEIIWINNLDLKGLLPKKVIRLVTTSFLIDFAKAIITKSKEITTKGEEAAKTSTPAPP